MLILNLKLIQTVSKICVFQLAAWRPGRYELGNFSQNIRNWCAFDENGVSLNFKKINKDL